jgi:2-polyprenyl-3-methyl-5-hydroxy-6-metoxy-1,4-benzoquinol methylase
MNYSRSPDAGIIESWHTNALAWTQAVRAQVIESRRLVTDQAIVDAIVDRHPHSVIDLGCGEGWLLRALAASLSHTSPHLTGFDAVPALIAQAREAGGAACQVATYEDLAAGRFNLSADVVVCNFSLLGKEPVDALLHAIPAWLSKGGALIVQTLHPLVACGAATYEDGWRATTWDGFGEQFTDPAPWYFRTLGSWLQRLRDAGLSLLEMREPLHPHTGKPASVIFVAEAVR